MNSRAHRCTSCAIAYWGLRRVSDPICGWKYKWGMTTGTKLKSFTRAANIRILLDTSPAFHIYILMKTSK